METIKSMEIDKQNKYRLYKKERQNKQINKKYSDRNAILINIDFISPQDVSRKKKMITSKGYKKHQTIIQEKEISKILENGELQDSYETWVDEVKNTIKQVEKIKTKNPETDIRKIQQKKIKAKTGTKDYQKQTRKVHTVRKSKNPERAHYRQTEREQSN